MFNYDWAYKAALPRAVKDNELATHHEYWLVCRFRDILMQLKVGDASPWLIANFYSRLDIDDDD